MKRQVEGVSEQILKCAEKEFLKKGFMDASLRDIAQKCDVSTSSIYTRFGDKAGLFEAVVAPVISELNSWFKISQKEIRSQNVNFQIGDLFLYSEEKIQFLVDYMYDHFTIFKLLISRSEGTSYSNFIHNFVETDMQYTMQCIENAGNDMLSSGRVTPELLHILSSSFYTGMLEPIVHDMSREKAYDYAAKLRRFYVCGWSDLLGCSNIKF